MNSNSIKAAVQYTVFCRVENAFVCISLMTIYVLQIALKIEKSIQKFSDMFKVWCWGWDQR